MCEWLVDKLAEKHGDLVRMPYLHAMEALLEEKEEEIWKALQSVELCAAGMHNQE